MRISHQLNSNHIKNQSKYFKKMIGDAITVCITDNDENLGSNKKREKKYNILFKKCLPRIQWNAFLSGRCTIHFVEYEI